MHAAVIFSLKIIEFMILNDLNYYNYSYPDIIVYLIYTTSFITMDEVRNYKSLASYKYFTAGWVLDMKWMKFDSQAGDCVLVVGKVRHSYSSSQTPLKPWVIIKSTGSVICGHCTCMAGQGETCSHIGAMLYWLETQVRIREQMPCTSQANKWMVPTAVKDIPYLQLHEVDFTTADKKMMNMAHGSASLENVSRTSSSTQLQATSDASRRLLQFFSEIAKEEEKKSIILSPYSDTFKQSNDHLPPQLQILFNSKNLELNYVQLLNLSDEFLSSITSISVSQQEHLEELTQRQSKSNDWYKFRAGRIIASRFHRITHTNPHMPAISLINNICYPETYKFTSKATTYGCIHEKDAVDAYTLQLRSDGKHDDVNVMTSGFFVSISKHFIGASPDALVDCKCCGQGILEVKCPLCAEHSTLTSVATANPHFCLVQEAGIALHLSRAHPYYYQCQLQLYVTDRQYCDFVVWTKEDVHVERILKDDSFLKNELAKAEMFFKLCVLPELFGKWFTRNHSCQVPYIGTVNDDDEEDDGNWCFCKEKKGGAMIECDNKHCPISWYHLECLQMIEAPKGKSKFYCPTCHATCRSVSRKRKHT